MKKNLVIVRAGDSSLHPEWMLPEFERNWDIVVSYYGDDPFVYKYDGQVRFDCKGTEYPAFYRLLTEGALKWDAYEYIWLPDDDLRISGNEINKLFDICAKHSLELAQPSLDEQSYISHLITRQNRKFVLRWTNFVEVMAPCFRQDALKKCLPTFCTSQSSWGLDYQWAKLLDNHKNIAIVDEVSLCHTRPVGGPLYDVLNSMGVNVQEEQKHALEKIGMDKFVVEPYAGILKNGKFFTYESRRSNFLQMLRLLFMGEHIAAYSLREKMRGTGKRTVKIIIIDQIFHWLKIN